MGGVVGVEQDLGVGLGQPGAAGLGVRGGVLDVQQPGHRLLLQPLAGVAGVDAGPLGQLVDRRRPLVPQASYSLSRRPSQTLASSADSIMLLSSRSASASRRPASSASAVPMVVVMAPPFPMIPGGGYLPHAAD